MSITAANLAEILNLSAPRVSQLSASGVLVKSPDGKFDEHASVRAYVEFLRRDQSSRDSKNRARDAQSFRQEQRFRREIRNLLTLGEVRAFADELFAWFMTYAQAESQRMYDTLAQTMPPMAARVATFERLFEPMQHAARTWRVGMHEALGALEHGHMGGERRVQSIVRGLRKRIDDAVAPKPARKKTRQPPSTETTA